MDHYQLRIKDLRLLSDLRSVLQQPGERHLKHLVRKTLPSGAKCPTMPVISKALRDLERFFGVTRLIRRPSHGTAAVAPTAEAEAVFRYADGLLSMYDNARTQATYKQRSEIRIAAEAMFEWGILPAAIARFYNEHDPRGLEASVRIRVQTVELAYPALEALLQNRIDVVLECNLSEPADPLIVREPPLIKGKPCQLERIVLIPKDKDLNAAMLDPDAKKAIRDLRDNGRSVVTLRELQGVPLAFVEYQDLTELALGSGTRSRRLNLATNAALVACVRTGAWVGLTINWRPLVGLPKGGRDWCQYKFLATESSGTRSRPYSTPLHVNILHRDPEVAPPSPALSHFIQILKDEVETVRSEQLIERKS